MEAKDTGVVREKVAKSEFKNAWKIRENIQAFDLALAIKEKEHSECINKMLVKENERLRASNISLMRHISILTEKEQLKANVKADKAKSVFSVLPKSTVFSVKSAIQAKPDTANSEDTLIQSEVVVNSKEKLKIIPLKVEPNNPWSSKIREVSEEYSCQKDKTVIKLPFEFLSQNTVVAPTVKLYAKRLKEGEKAKNMQRKNKRRRSRQENKTMKKRRKTHLYTCSKCGQFEGRSLLSRYNGVQHQCGFFQRQITFTQGKVHRRYGTLILKGSFSERQMKFKLEEAVSLNKV